MAVKRQVCGWLAGLMVLWVWSHCAGASEGLYYCGSALRLASAKENEETLRQAKAQAPPATDTDSSKPTEDDHED